MRSGLEILNMWDDLDIDYKNKHLIFYCGTGWRAAEVMYYAELMGLNKVSLYDGGWYEWSSKFGKIDQEQVDGESEEPITTKLTTSMTSVILETISAENINTMDSGQQTTRIAVSETTTSFNSGNMNSCFNVLLAIFLFIFPFLCKLF